MEKTESPPFSAVSGHGATYRLLSRIGTGRFADVYLAQGPNGERYAVKVLKSDCGMSNEVFEREYRLTPGVDHPSLRRAIDKGTEQGRNFIVFTFVDGVSINQFALELWADLQSDSSVKVPQKQELYRKVLMTHLAQLADAVEGFSKNQLVHRDIKPDNILIADPDCDGVARAILIDFGLARETARKSDIGDDLGSWLYMSPEQGDDARSVTFKSDIYSLGIVFYELLSRARPVTRRQEALKIKQSAALSLAKQVPNCPADLNTIIERCTARLPEHRYASAAELAEDARLFIENKPIATRRLTVVQRINSLRKREPAISHMLALSTTLILAIVSLVAVFLWKAYEYSWNENQQSLKLLAAQERINQQQLENNLQQLENHRQEREKHRQEKARGLEQMGDRMVESSRWDVAAKYFDEALNELLENDDPTELELRSRLMLKAGQSLLFANLPSRAVQTLQQAVLVSERFRSASYKGAQSQSEFLINNTKLLLARAIIKSSSAEKPPEKAVLLLDEVADNYMHLSQEKIHNSEVMVLMQCRDLLFAAGDGPRAANLAAFLAQRAPNSKRRFEHQLVHAWILAKSDPQACVELLETLEASKDYEQFPVKPTGQLGEVYLSLAEFQPQRAEEHLQKAIRFLGEHSCPDCDFSKARAWMILAGRSEMTKQGEMEVNARLALASAIRKAAEERAPINKKAIRDMLLFKNIAQSGEVKSLLETAPELPPVTMPQLSLESLFHATFPLKTQMGHVFPPRRLPIAEINWSSNPIPLRGSSNKVLYTTRSHILNRRTEVLWKGSSVIDLE